MISLIDSSPVAVPHFERVLMEVDTSIKVAYQAASASDTERQLVEKHLLVKGEIPAALMPAVEKLLTTSMDTLREEIDPAALYFADHSWLGMSDDQATRKWGMTHTVDSVRKVVLSRSVCGGGADDDDDGDGDWVLVAAAGEGEVREKKKRLRRCTRCCAYMEDLPPHRGISAWTLNIQKMCFCGSMWMLLD